MHEFQLQKRNEAFGGREREKHAGCGCTILLKNSPTPERGVDGDERCVQGCCSLIGVPRILQWRGYTGEDRKFSKRGRAREYGDHSGVQRQSPGMGLGEM